MYPVQEFTIAGNLREMFQNIEAVGSDFNPRKKYPGGQYKNQPSHHSGGVSHESKFNAGP